MKLYWMVFICVGVTWASEKPQKKITYYFKYDKVAKKNIPIFKYVSGEYTLDKRALPKPPLRRQMVINDIHEYMKSITPKDDIDKNEKEIDNK